MPWRAADRHGQVRSSYSAIRERFDIASITSHDSAEDVLVGDGLKLTAAVAPRSYCRVALWRGLIQPWCKLARPALCRGAIVSIKRDENISIVGARAQSKRPGGRPHGDRPETA